MIPIQEALRAWAHALNAATIAGILNDGQAHRLWLNTGEKAWEERLCESPVELGFLREMRKDHSLDRFKPNVKVMDGKYRIDFADTNTLTGVEIDGYAYHSDKDTFVKDRQRQREIEQNGWRITRFAGAEVHHDPAGSVQAFKQWLSTVATPPSVRKDPLQALAAAYPASRPAPVDPGTGRAILGGRARAT